MLFSRYRSVPAFVIQVVLQPDGVIGSVSGPDNEYVNESVSVLWCVTVMQRDRET